MDSDQTNTRVEITQVYSEQEASFDYYSCEEAITRLNDYLDQELTPAERADVVKHLQICQPCLERFRFEETLITSIRLKVAAIVAPERLKDRLSGVFRGMCKKPD